MEFIYTTVESDGVEREGMVEAASEEAAIAALQRRGLIVVRIRQSSQPKGLNINIPFLTKKVSHKDVVILSRQIATLFDAKVSALRVFTLLAGETENPKLSEALAHISESLQGGSPISRALESHPEIFSRFYINMVASGEESGRLADVFMYLADYLDRQYELTSKAKNALIYPAFVITTFFAVMWLMLTFVIPKIGSILGDSGQAIPIYTKIVLGLSAFLVDFGFLILAALIIGVVLLIRYARTEHGKRVVDRLRLQVPYVGNLFRKLYLSRLSDNMNTMLSSGIPMVRSIEITASVIGNSIYYDLLMDAVENVKGGKSVADSLSQAEEIPAVMIQMIKIGEETGSLGKILKTLADFYAREVKNAVDALIDLIEPAMIVLLGIGVGTLLASVLIPIYNVSTSF